MSFELSFFKTCNWIIFQQILFECLPGTDTLEVQKKHPSSRSIHSSQRDIVDFKLYYQWPSLKIILHYLIIKKNIFRKKMRGQSLLILKLCGFRYNVAKSNSSSCQLIFLVTFNPLLAQKSIGHSCPFSLEPRVSFQGQSYYSTYFSAYMCDEFAKYFNTLSNWPRTPLWGMILQLNRWGHWVLELQGDLPKSSVPVGNVHKITGHSYVWLCLWPTPWCGLNYLIFLL